MSRLVSVACLVACMSLIPARGFAKEPQAEAPAAGSEAKPAPGGVQPPSCVRPRDLVSTEEVSAHRAKMGSAQTPEEREALRKEWRAELASRAAKQGKVLCGPPGGGGAGMGRGMGPGGGRSPMGRGGPPPTGGAMPPEPATPPTGGSAPQP